MNADLAVGGLVSCIVPVFNARPYVAAAIESVFSQTYGALEIVAVDDGSCDGSVEYLLQAYGNRMTLILQDHGGMAAARNRALRSAKGEYVSFIDADDLWPAERLECLVAVLKQEAGLSACFGGARNFWDDPDLERRDMESSGEIWADRLRNTVTAGLFRRCVFDRIGMFDERYRNCSEHEWLMRLKDAGCLIGHVDAVLYLRRVHHSNLSRGKKIDGEMAQIVAERLIRMRRREG